MESKLFKLSGLRFKEKQYQIKSNRKENMITNLFMKINIFNELNKYTGLGLNVGVYMDCCITDKKPILDPEYRDLEMVSHHLSKLFYLHEERIIGNMEASIEAIKVIKDIQKTVEYIGGEYKMKVREYTLKIIEKVVNND